MGIAKEYVVEWAIEVVADSPEAAAKAAWDMMRDPDSTANVFDVIEADGSGEAVQVDLQDELEEEGTDG